jgi:DNA helicase HerA-like ATPase
MKLGTINIPTQAATKTFAILAKRGAGKSYTGAVMAEEFYKNSIPFVVFDPIDVWWGLRFNKDGKNKGLPIVVFGLVHADILL